MTYTELDSALASYSTVSLTGESSYPLFMVKNSACEGRVALHGAHLLSWQPVGEEHPVLYTSPEAIYKLGKPVRGGVPICWPWFNAHPTDASLPSHGFARNRFWEFLEVEEGTDYTVLTFQLRADAGTKALWEANFRVVARITLGETAAVQVTTENCGEQDITVGGALHTYFSVGEITNTSVTGFEGCTYVDTVGGGAIEKRQEGAVTFTSEVDSIYINTTAPAHIIDKSWSRQVRVERGGSASAVVWNPWDKKAQEIGDLPDSSYHHFVCIEAANAREDFYGLKAGESHTLSTTISVVR